MHLNLNINSLLFDWPQVPSDSIAVDRVVHVVGIFNRLVLDLNDLIQKPSPIVQPFLLRWRVLHDRYVKCDEQREHQAKSRFLLLGLFICEAELYTRRKPETSE